MRGLFACRMLLDWAVGCGPRAVGATGFRYVELKPPRTIIPTQDGSVRSRGAMSHAGTITVAFGQHRRIRTVMRQPLLPPRPRLRVSRFDPHQRARCSDSGHPRHSHSGCEWPQRHPQSREDRATRDTRSVHPLLVGMAARPRNGLAKNSGGLAIILSPSAYARPEFWWS